MNFIVEFEQEDDGRWIAEIPTLPGVMVCGASQDEATYEAEVLALQVLEQSIYGPI